MMDDIITRYSDRSRYNLLLPPTFAISQVGGLYQVSFREVSLDADVKSKEVYTYTGLGGVAIGKAGLDKLAALAGVTWDPKDSGFLDAPKGMLRYRAIGALRNSDGTPIVAMSTKTEFYSGMHPEKFDCEKVESKARNRVIRQLLGIKSTYSPEELKKPFVVLRVDLALDMNDPNIKMLVAQKAVDMMTNLFGGGNQGQLPAASAQAFLPATVAVPQLGPGTVLPESSDPDPEDLIEVEPESSASVGPEKCEKCSKKFTDAQRATIAEKGYKPICYECNQKAKKAQTPPPAQGSPDGTLPLDAKL